MTRRLFIGKTPAGEFKFRQSLPGADALTADLDHLVFDADYVPGRVLGTGSFVMPGTPVPYQQLSTAFPHGSATRPGAILCVGRQLDYQSYQPTYWRAYYSSPAPGFPGGITAVGPQGWSTPFYYANEQYLSGNYVGYARSGFWMVVDDVNAGAYNRSPYPIEVKYMLLEVG